jgi:uncharacterized protein (DUF302 family)
MVTVQCRYSVEPTVERRQETLRSRGIKSFAVID